ncbi:Phosphoribosylformylglycinamidine synthase [Planctomycetes bacterium Poly30]|uniref:Phosphoribosylformylglycinamidine synthase n=1 Tax=Saltatorellus ferox TaxID=2528018 RepID=A0A518EU21_9BACT|nr:Phosphoribosylformylglycinamidine synthase [Planctomycetes bacterium Poly30]
MTTAQAATSTRPKALVLRGPGTNCEDETLRALRMGGADADLLRTDVAAREPSRLDGYAVLVIAGGFSYGDDLAAGRVWGSSLRSGNGDGGALGGGLGGALKAHVARGGRILGVCNGFQVLVESGLFEPGTTHEERSIALFANASNHYECRWVTLEVQESRCDWLVAGERMPTPVAHGEGRFAVKDDSALERLRSQGQIVLTYVNDKGKAGEPAGYPANPNGAVADIAGICDPTGRVVGLMPHPERNLDPWNHPQWTRLEGSGPRRTEGEGLAFYRALVESASRASL